MAELQRFNIAWPSKRANKKHKDRVALDIATTSREGCRDILKSNGSVEKIVDERLSHMWWNLDSRQRRMIVLPWYHQESAMV